MSGRPAIRATLATLATIGGLGVALLFAWGADDFYHEDDICHYLLAHDGWHDADAALHYWARPGFTLPMMVADRLGGLRGCRVLSALLTGLTALLAWGIAREITKGDEATAGAIWLAPALVWLQPLALTLAQTTLTETPAAFYVAFAVWLALRKRVVAACFVTSLLFVTRIETAVFAPALALLLLGRAWRVHGGIAAFRSRELWLAGAALAWAPVAWVVASWWFHVSPEVSPTALLSRTYVDAYGTGPWHHFAVRWLIAAGVGVLALAAAGALRLGRRAWLPAGAALAYVLLHTVLFRFGLFASGGYERFLVPVAGLVGALAASGVGALWHARARGPVLAALLVLAGAALAPLEHDVPDGVRVPLIVLAVVLVLLAIPGRHVARFVGALALVVGLLQCVALVRPLVVARPLPPLVEIPLDETASTATWHWEQAYFARPLAPRSLFEDALLMHALERGEAASPRAPLITSKAFVRAHRLHARRVEDPDLARRLWREAEPGTVFLWGGVRVGDAYRPFGSTEAELPRWGRVVAEYAYGPFEAKAYVRSAD